jgi:hypothetical protein
MAIAHYDKQYLTLRFLPNEDLYTFMRRAQNIFRDNWLVKMAEHLQDNFRMEKIHRLEAIDRLLLPIDNKQLLSIASKR